jgi:hypothetical protein
MDKLARALTEKYVLADLALSPASRTATGYVFVHTLSKQRRTVAVRLAGDRGLKR